MFTIDATSLHRYMNCNGSRFLTPPQIDKEVEDTKTRDEGNAAHFMAMMVFTGRHTLEELVDRKAPNGIYMSFEMSQFVEQYLEVCGHFGSMEIETGYNTAISRVNGRADHIYYNADQLIVDRDGVVLSEPDTLHVNDFKYGWSIVDPEMNWTLISHAVGYCIANQLAPSKIQLSIFQPRPHHSEGKFRSWTITYNELMEFCTQIYSAVDGPNTELHTGPHCYKCPALATCPAARKASMNAIDVSETVYDDDVDDALISFTLDQLERARQVIEHRQHALEELAKHRIKAGHVIANYSVEHQLSNTKWKDGVDINMLSALTGKKLTTEKIVTPAEAKRRGVLEAVIKPLTERVPVGTKLVRIDASKKAEKLLGRKESE